jgi:hypothetical protein
MFQWRFVGGLKYAKKLLVTKNKMISLIPDPRLPERAGRTGR